MGKLTLLYKRWNNMMYTTKENDYKNYLRIDAVHSYVMKNPYSEEVNHINSNLENDNQIF